MMRRPLIFALAAALFTAAAPAAAKPKAPKLDREVWYGFEFLGNKVGYMVARDEGTLLNDQPAYHLNRHTVVTVKRKAEVINVESSTDLWVTPDLTPLRFKNERREGREVRTVEGYRDGSSFVIRRALGGNLEERRIPMKGLRLAMSLDLLLYRGLAKGKKWTGRALGEEDGDVHDYEVEVTEAKGKGKAQRFVVKSRVGKLATLSVVEPDGTIETTEVVGIGAKYTKMPRDEAVNLTAELDVFSRGLFESPVPLPPGHQLDKITVKLETKSGQPPRYKADRRQKVKRKRKKSVTLELSTDRPPKKAPRLPIQNKKLKVFLKETPYEPLLDERLVATAQRVVGAEKDAWAAARAINAFVFRHIQNKSLARAYATAPEALATREGDCTEHATLFSALAKIVGIPTRHATGLVYVGQKDNVFGYHEWVEVWMGSAGWVAMDPTFGQDIADATHIKFAQGQTDSEGLQEAGITAAAVIGDLDLSVLEYVTVDGAKKKI
ncbi:MAG: transglutaminase-like domain-containing protein [Deltaproteobacteria bacterium]